MKYKRKDINQNKIEKSLRQIPGISIKDISSTGGGIGDLLIGYRSLNYLLEIKNPAKCKSAKKLTPAEAEFHRTWQGQITIVETLDEILELLQIN